MTSVNLGVRKDDFSETIFNKEKYTLDLATELKVDLYAVVGDFFHNKNISYGYMNRIEELFKSYQGRGFAISCVYGNHDCSFPGTEILTENGWIKVEECEKVKCKIAQFDMIDGKVSFDYPLRYVESWSDFVYNIESHHSRQVVSGGHNVILDGVKVKARDIDLSKGINNLRLYGFSDKVDYGIPDDMIRLLVHVVSDGCLVYRGDSIHLVQFKLSKERKILELRHLLDMMGISYTFKVCKKYGCNVLQPYYIRIYGKYARDIATLLCGVKSFPKFFRLLSTRQFRLVLDTIEITDGNKVKNTINLNTTSKSDADMLQELSIVNGFPCTVKAKEGLSGFDNGKTQYVLHINDGGKVASDRGPDGITISKNIYNGPVYCVTMPLGTIITRFEGKVAFTGNCYNEQPDSIGRTPLGNMFVNGIFAPKIGTYVLEYSDTICVYFPFMSKPSSFVVPNPHNKTLVLFTHYFFDCGFDEDEKLPMALTEQFDYIFTGHDHDPYPVVKVNKATIIRPGALSRGTRHKSQWNRPVQVAYLDTVTGECKYIPVPCAKAEDVFNVEGLELADKIKGARDVSSLGKSVELSSFMKVGDLLESYKLRSDLLSRTDEWLVEGGIK